MTVKSLRDILNQRPFRPFRLVMSSGQSYDVRQRKMAFLTLADILVGIGEAEEGVPDAFRICPLVKIAAVEPLNTARGDTR